MAQRYDVGKEITGTVTNLTDFGVFVEIEEGIEGLIHVSEISKEKIKTPVGKFNIGDVITAKVMNINTTSTFGEILRENLQGKLDEE